jgi:hypothetical protein
MKRLFLLARLRFALFLVILLGISNLFGQNPESELRFPVKIEGKWGYVDQLGKLVIPAKFERAAYFEEGLAAVRQNGRFGYVDVSGKMVIPASFDFAESFYKGTALVYKKAKPYFIDTKGNILFEHNFKSMDGMFDGKCAIVYDQTGDCGLVDRQGRLLVDTNYRMIEPFAEGLAVVYPLWVDHDSLWEATSDTNEIKKALGIGVVDLEGRFVVPMGSYSACAGFSDGLAAVNIFHWDENSEGPDLVIDKEGKIANAKNGIQWFFIHNYYYHGGLAIVQKNTETNKDKYPVAINKAGEIVIDNPDFRTITPFSDGRAFAETKDHKWLLIDQTGKQIGSHSAKRVYWWESAKFPPFQNGSALVLVDEGWGTIDVAGNVKFPANRFDDNFYPIRFDNWIVFEQQSLNNSKNIVPMSFGYCAWNLNTDHLITGNFDKYEIIAGNSTLIRLSQKGIDYLLNDHGKEIWKSKPRKEAQSQALNVDFMVSANYPYFALKSDSTLSTIDGEPCSHFKNLPKGKVGCYLETSNPSKIRAYKQLTLGNDTDAPIYLRSIEMSIDILLEAKNENGEWQAIEYFRENPCYDQATNWVALRPHEAQAFYIPVYEGSNPTMMRLRLKYSDNSDGANAKTFYSEEFKGSVNPAQFWRKVAYWEEDRDLGK